MPQDALGRYFFETEETMTFDELKEKALSLPYAPGVYIMRDKTDKVIYVGKAKKQAIKNLQLQLDVLLADIVLTVVQKN